ncbi:XtrA/YqaO family protein [Bacillus sp. JJ722]|uniref:XtrA/YqaO family protein n=1 Tax=Bacillus sp. JJ722 TaxID=3122973 RepID=UPI002FFEF576
MRLKDIEINPRTMRLEVDILDLPKSCVIVICDGKAKLRYLPDHGEYRIVTHQGKVKRMRKEEGEEF